MASNTVSSDTVERAVHALLKWKVEKAKTEKPQLLEHDEFFYLILTLKKIPQGRTNPFKIPIPHALIDPEVAETCLIIDDRPTSNLTKAAAQEKIKAEGIQVSKVMKLSKLRTDYKAFESKRKLCDSYDMFLADKRVLPVLPKVLGKQFFKKKKIPVGVDLTHKNWKEQIERVYGSALLFLGTGTCSVVRVARISIGEKEIAENVLAAIKGITEVVPRKWGNVRSFHVKMLDSLALPIYQTVPDVKLKIEGLKDKQEKELKEAREKGEVKDEVSVVKKKGPKKGRIHEVKYMDADLDEIVDDDDSDNNAIDNASEDYETVAVGKKRKKGGAEKEAVAELNGVKMVKNSAKLKKGRSVEEEKSVVSEKLKKSDSTKKKRKDSSSVKGDEEFREKGEVKDEVSAVTKKGTKKGRIHEVKFMDSDLDKIVDGDDSDNNAIDGATDNYETVALGKKRKGGAEKKEAVAELKGDKRVKKSAKLKKVSSVEEEKSVVSEKLKKSDSDKKKDSSTVKGVEELNSEKEKQKTKKDISTVEGVKEIKVEKKKTKKKL